MRRRQLLPLIWLMTDERIANLGAAIAALPPRSGIIFRHYTLTSGKRRALFMTVRRIARAQNHVLILASRPAKARQWGADGAHDRSGHASLGWRTAPVHTIRDRIQAQRIGADLVFVSPVRPTRSHPAARTLGRLGFARIAGDIRTRSVVLGGMNREQFERMRALKPYGWAAIDALDPLPN
jgi:thiamine-phosphate pyrophosphorylase